MRIEGQHEEEKDRHMAIMTPKKKEGKGQI